ncbi:MAG: gamma-glutamyl-gamma-aminobutyrate hydrolase family protein [Candidatus Dadabacteria bacterium]|nr:gamma-glutamyl-gamma-aminobutyrate hydrolase family protein [Candidatus Dadabacteria bacterium]MYI72740.1 gamma-glutamyl-gamma-aminobutyrate hydrolase family protein [Candidatus Dadabacteria bacterium]
MKPWSAALPFNRKEKLFEKEHMKARPLIGITTDLEDKSNLIESAYSKTVEFYGGAPVLIPTVAEASSSDFLLNIISAINGLLIPGSRDMDPKFYGESPHPAINPMSPERTETEFAVLRLALEKDVPVLGICGGMQFINVFHGGSIHQDIRALLPDALCHEGGEVHDVTVLPDTVFGGFTEEKEFEIKSYHHQAINRVGDGLRVNALAPDGIVEGFESADGRVMGFQWHPELERTPLSELIFTRFLSEAAQTADGSPCIG